MSEETGSPAEPSAEAPVAQAAPDRVKFYLSQPRYLRQAGEQAERYIEASPNAPVVVVLPAKILRKQKDGSVVELDQPEDAWLKRVPQAPPKDVRPGAQPKAPVRAHEVGRKSRGGRAADQ